MAKASRRVCDIEFRNLSDKSPFLWFDDGNVTGLDFSSSISYAKRAGNNAIGFDDPIDGTLKIECQLATTKLYALLSDGTINTSATTSTKKTIVCETEGTLTLPSTPVSGTVFVYAFGDYAGTIIEGTVSETTFTATTPAQIVKGTSYEVGYLTVESSGVKAVEFNNSKTTKDYYVTMLTDEKDESGVITPKKIICYKVKPTRTLSLSYSSEGDPISISIECACLEDADGKQIEIVEYTGE